MLVITRKGKKIGGTHYVYKKAEALENNIRWVTDWKIAEAGDWVLTDDGWVGQLIYVKVYEDKRPGRNKTKSRRFMYFSFGTTTDKSKKLMLTELIISMRTVSNKPWDVQAMNKFRFRLFEMYYCYMVLREGKINYAVLANILGDKSERHSMVRRYLKSERIKTRLVMSLKKLMEEQGITREQIIKDMAKIKEQAVKGGNLKIGLEVLDRFAKYIGMDDGDIPLDGQHRLPADTSMADMMEKRFEKLMAADPGRIEAGYIRQGDGAVPAVADVDGNPVKRVGRGDE